ncbi:hypothetical protein V2G26_004914 [Clonostachys chloroleuca]
MPHPLYGGGCMLSSRCMRSLGTTDAPVNIDLPVASFDKLPDQKLVHPPFGQLKVGKVETEAAASRAGRDADYSPWQTKRCLVSIQLARDYAIPVAALDDFVVALGLLWVGEADDDAVGLQVDFHVEWALDVI